MALRVAIPDLVSPSYFPAIAAVELGLFRREGLDAAIELIYPVTKTYAELREGRVDFVGGAAHAALYAFPDWTDGKLVCALARHMYWFLVLRADAGAKRGELHKVKGLRIGAAPGPVDGLRQMLRDAGIDPERDVQIGPVPVPIGAGVSFGVTAAKALDAGEIDGFWANGMGAAVAVRNRVGTLVVDARRGDGPPGARDYTFPALVTTQQKIDAEPASVAAAVRAIAGAQAALKEDPERATAIGRKLFPEAEAGLIAELIRRDAPFYDPTISEATVEAMNRFARGIGLLSQPVPYGQVVATRFRDLWAG
jgi:ABC-type nitrate/sulfonate/bicarbonate transport system substrate-binding protein